MTSFIEQLGGNLIIIIVIERGDTVEKIFISSSSKELFIYIFTFMKEKYNLIMNSRNQSMLNIRYCSQGGHDYINQLVNDQQT